MYVDTLKIKNLRGFEQAEMRLNYPGRKYPKGVTPPRLQNVNLLLGENGSGKSTVFRALCIGVLRDYLNSSGFISDDNIKHQTLGSEISISLWLDTWDSWSGGPYMPEPVEEWEESGITSIQLVGTKETLRFGARTTWDNRLNYEDVPSFILLGYGANRRTERPEAYNEALRSPRYQRVASLFEPQVGLIPFSTAVTTWGQNKRIDVAELLNNTLDDTTRMVPNQTRKISSAQHRKPGEYSLSYEPYVFDVGNTHVKFTSLSDGYRTFIGWLADLLTHLVRLAPDGADIAEMRGVVIVDEVDLLLHPAWQRTVVEKLATTFPNLQFLFSTHSPIVAATLDAANIFVTRDGKIEQFTEPIAGKSIDAALTSPYFGLPSPRSPELERNLGELAEKAMEGDFDASLQFLRLLRTGNDTAAKAGNGA